MIYAGIQKTSLVDYPGRICTTLFVRGCNMDCIYCHNPALSKESNLTTFDYTISYILNYLKNAKHIKAVCISGGEPTIYNDLLCDISKMKNLFDLSIKVDTNGSRPEMIMAIRRYVNYLAMDFKGLYPSLFRDRKSVV